LSEAGVYPRLNPPMNPDNILFLCNFFPPTHTAGTENYTYNLARALVNAGMQVHVLCIGRWDVDEAHWNGFTDECYHEIKVRRLHLNWQKAADPNTYLYDNPVVAQHLAEYLGQIQPDLVHITSCYTLSSSVIEAVRSAGLPIVLTLTDFWFLCPRLTLLRSDGQLCSGNTTAWECLRCLSQDSKVYRLLSHMLPQPAVAALLTSASQAGRITSRRGMRGILLNMAERKPLLLERLAQVDYLISPSQFLRQVFADNGFAQPIKFLPHGHHLNWVRPHRYQPSSPLRIAYVGQISPIKGVELLVRAFQQLSVQVEATLTIFGDMNKNPAYTDSLRAGAQGNPYIHFPGPFTREEIGAVFAQIDVLVVPSLWYENNPLSIQEAFAMHIPVITSNLGGMAEFVHHEKNGLLFAPGDVSDLARQLLRVATEPGLLAALSEGIEVVKPIEQEVEELLTIYQALHKPM
jgi:glycosyltransferase involved in cell wall biosynthesis